ncbi:MAG: class I SAM-dependent DNA methyltransferase [Polyangiales bacterium]
MARDDLTLTRARLEAGLWAAAQALRGAIDAADYRGVILGAVFLKRLSDVADEGDRAFSVPEAARWSALRGVTAGVGEALQRACERLEGANPSLAGVLTAAGFDAPHRLGPADQRDRALRALLDALHPLPLGRRALADPDVLGRAYEYLLARFADDAGRKGGEFYTPPAVVRLLVELLDPQPGMRVCDPTCGSGGMLVAVGEHLRAAGHDPAGITLHGQEKNAATWAIARMNLVLHGLTDARVELGDTLRAPKLLGRKGLQRYDRVIANPPFSLRDWGRAEAAADPFGRFPHGLPPDGRGDLAFVQHMVATLEPRGAAAVVLPQGALFRGGREGQIRVSLLRAGLVDAVVALPHGLFHGTPIPASVLVLRRGRDPDAGVRMVDARDLYAPGARQNALRDEDLARIVAALRSNDAASGFAATVAVRELVEGGGALSPARHVGGAALRGPSAVDEALEALRRSARERDAAERALRDALAGLHEA